MQFRFFSHNYHVQFSLLITYHCLPHANHDHYYCQYCRYSQSYIHAHGHHQCSCLDCCWLLSMRVSCCLGSLSRGLCDKDPLRRVDLPSPSFSFLNPSCCCKIPTLGCQVAFQRAFFTSKTLRIMNPNLSKALNFKSSSPSFVRERVLKL